MYFAIYYIRIFIKFPKQYLQDGARYMALLSSQIASLEQSKKIYEKANRESDRAVENFHRADSDLNLSRAEVEKQKMNMSMKKQNCEQAKSDYANQLQKTNELQVSIYNKIARTCFFCVRVNVCLDVFLSILKFSTKFHRHNSSIIINV